MGLVVLSDQIGLTTLEMSPAVSGKHIQLSLHHVHQHVLLHDRLEFLLLIDSTTEEGLHVIVELYSGFEHT